jgi:hypothetical protein
MRKILLSIAIISGATIGASAQEGSAELSKKARKGFIAEAVPENGGYNIIYKMAGDKNKDEISYESYSFAPDLRFVKSEVTKAPKQTSEDKPDKTINSIQARVGGCTSFDILSMKLRFTKASILKTWDYKQQRYVTAKVLSSETFKMKNENGNMIGYAAFNDPNDENMFVLAGADSKENKRGMDYFILTTGVDGEIAQKPADITGSQILVYAGQMQSGDVALVFAPRKGSPDLSAYTYLRYSCNGELKNMVPFKAPSSNTLVMDVSEQAGSVFFCATSTKSDEGYDDVFAEYAGAISNPCFTDAENKLDLKWMNKANARMESFHLLRFTDNKFDFGSTAAISEFKSKFKKTADNKHADPYTGKKLAVEDFTITADGEYLIAGQLTGREKVGSSNSVKTYEDIVCLHFDKNGQLKAQYGVEKMNNDKKSSAFPVIQSFKPSKDGRSLHWLVLEVKGFKGYESFIDAYNGNETWYARYFPRLAKLDAQSTSLGSFKVLGDEKYYCSKSQMPIANPQENSMVFIGSDEDNKNVWLAKYVFD